MILSPAKDMTRVSPDKFKWFIQSLRNSTRVIGANGTGHYDAEKRLVAMEVDGKLYVKIKP